MAPFTSLHVVLPLLAAFSRAGPASGTAATSSTAAVAPSCTAHLNGQPPSPTPSSFNFDGTVRRYYVAAEEVEWDYVPTGWDNWMGVPIKDSPRAQQAGATQFGTKWLKALYRGYTDASFTTYSPQPPWQGTQGPTIRAEVGDLIEILFVNKLSKAYATMHSMGLAYTKAMEGSDYANNTMPGQNVVIPAADAVPPVDKGVGPGECVVYKWMVEEVDGPNPGTGIPAITHSYHSYVTLRHDSAAGLIGPTIIYAKGAMAPTMASYREFPILYKPFDENESWLSGQNADQLSPKHRAKKPGYGISSVQHPAIYSGGNHSVWYPQAVNLAESDQFPGAPTYFSLSGYIFANNPTYEMCLNDKAIWYLNAYGAASHVFHMHGNSFSYNGIFEYAESVNDGVGKTLYMNATNQGLWQVVCHVADHHDMGMVSNYRIYPAGQCPLPALT